MSSKFRVVYTVPSNATTVKGKLRLYAGSGSTSAGEQIERVASYTNAIAGGAYNGKLEVTTTAVSATGFIGPLNGADSDDTVTIGGTVLSASASTQDATNWKIGASDAITGDNLALCINTNTTTNKYVVAVSDGAGTVNLTAFVPGTIGNLVTLASSDGTEVPVSASALTGGSEDAVITLHKGV